MRMFWLVFDLQFIIKLRFPVNQSISDVIIIITIIIIIIMIIIII